MRTKRNPLRFVVEITVSSGLLPKTAATRLIQKLSQDLVYEEIVVYVDNTPAVVAEWKRKETV